MPPRGGHNRGDQNSMTRVTYNQPYEHTIFQHREDHPEEAQQDYRSRQPKRRMRQDHPQCTARRPACPQTPLSSRHARR